MWTALYYLLMPLYISIYTHIYIVSKIGAVVKVVDSHPCGWDSIPATAAVFLIVSLNKELMCSDKHVKYWIPREFPLTSSLLLDYRVE